MRWSSVNGLFSGAIFIAAGVYQFSALKHACLMRCQQPFPFFFANWATTEAGVFRLGLKQGVYCLGCCWAMMLLMFAVGAWFFANTVGHVQERFDIWLDPFADPEGDGFQVAQSLFAQADGGLFGRGLGESLVQLPEITPKCADDFPNCGAILPAPHTDFIYAVIVNELGLFGGGAVVLIYALITERGFKTAILADDGFSKLLATGLTTIVALQAFVIIGGVTRVIPITGVTLPFISYGGSSIVANFILLGLLLSISDKARRRTRREAEALEAEYS